MSYNAQQNVGKITKNIKRGSRQFALALLLIAFAFSVTPLAQANPVEKVEPQATAQEPEIGRLIPIWDVTLNAPLDFPPCATLLPARSADGGSCMTKSDPKNVQTLPFFEYVTSIGAIWYSTYDSIRPVPPLLINDSPTVGLDENGRVVYLMTYPMSDEASQEAVFTMLKGLFGEPAIDIKRDQEWIPDSLKVITDEWYMVDYGGRIAFWNNDEVWVRYIFKTRSSPEGILAVGLKRILNEDEDMIPPLYSY